MLYAYWTPAVEFAVLRPWARFTAACALLALAAALISRVRARSLAELPSLVFEEEDPEAVFEGFHLSEGAAAKPGLT